MKNCCYLLIPVVLTIWLIGCSASHNKTQPNNQVYKNENFGFTLTFPAGWESRYFAEETNNVVSIHHKSAAQPTRIIKLYPWLSLRLSQI